jgi:hypothetical protein
MVCYSGLILVTFWFESLLVMIQLIFGICFLRHRNLLWAAAGVASEYASEYASNLSDTDVAYVL